MATFVEAATRWAQQLALQKHANVAILCQSVKCLAYAVEGPMAHFGHDHRTACVNLLQASHGATGNLLALSYPPTAACVGMAMLVGIRRIVWNAADGTPQSLTLSTGGAPQLFNGRPQAVVFQASKDDFASVPLPNMPEAYPISIRPHQFCVPAGTDDLVSSLIGPDDVVRDNMCMQLAFTVAAAAHGPLWPGPGNVVRRRPENYGQNIAAVLVDQNYRLLGWAVNTNVKHPTLHGEMNLVRGFQRVTNAALPANGKLFTTLEPCSMCSGMLVHAAGANSFTVVSGQADRQVGFSALRNARNTDGYTGIARQVQHQIAATPLLLSSVFDGAMNQAQQDLSQGGRLMPTTRFLETDKGRSFMVDALRMLYMQAALWLPAATRAPWRRKLESFVQFVELVA